MYIYNNNNLYFFSLTEHFTVLKTTAAFQLNFNSSHALCRSVMSNFKQKEIIGKENFSLTLKKAGTNENIDFKCNKMSFQPCVIIFLVSLCLLSGSQL